MIYSDSIRFADPTDEEDYFNANGKSGRYRKWDLSTCTHAEFDNDGRTNSVKFMDKDGNFEKFANR
jgi:hypothetical protein